MPDLLANADVNAALGDLPDWTYTDGTLSKTWELKGFLGALVLANAIGHVCNAMKHHPDLRVHDYNQLTVTLTTHSAGGVTTNDLEAARRIEQLG